MISKEYDFVCLVTNQPTIAMGRLSIKKLDKINSIIIKYCLSKGFKIDVVSFCPHHPQFGFKNELKFLKKIVFVESQIQDYLLNRAFLRNINLINLLMIGDSEKILKRQKMQAVNLKM